MMDNIQKEGMLKVGTFLANGKYRIDQYIASGGFGNTYVATDMAFDEKVAIKELFIKGVCGRSIDSCDISISLTENKRTFSAQQEKFRKEAKRLRKLNNPHIVKVHNLFDENGTSYYVMDFVEGESLSTRLKRIKNPIQEEDLMLLLPQILDALECVHNEGIWHLDLKPANIMIDAKGNVQLIDFGASKQLRNANGDSFSTSSAISYSPGYAPSEQMEQNFEKFGPWTDIYSLGATMYSILSMQQPPSPSDIDEDARTALKLPNGISKKTEELIFWMMKPNRKMRPQSVSDIRQFLMEYKEEKSPDTTPVDSGEDNRDDDTVLKTGGSKDSKDKRHSRFSIWLKYIVVLCFFCLAIFVIFGVVKCTSSSEKTDDIEVIQIDTISKVKNVNIDMIKIYPTKSKDSFCSLEKYQYSGSVNRDTIPNGYGKAIFTDGRYYEGTFRGGYCEGDNVTFVFPNGDSFYGTMHENQFVKGRYTIKSDGSYFEGTFKDGQPDEGQWH